MRANVNPPSLSDISVPHEWRALVQTSRDLLAAVQDPGGAWPASPAFAPYRYSWFRDGSFIAEGASAAGLHEPADAFHRWCTSVLEREAPAVEAVLARLAAGEEPEDHEYLPARYSLDGTRHVDDWWNFQVDGYGTWLWALERHLARTGADASPYVPAVRTATRYLVGTGRRTCRDWWEENRDQTHVATLAGVAAGLRSAVRLGHLLPHDLLPDDLAAAATATAEAAIADVLDRGVHDGRLAKWLGGTAVDASLLAVSAVYDVLPIDHPVVRATVAAVEDRLAPSGGGVHRYEADTFYGGGQWPVLAALLAWHHARAGAPERDSELLGWVVSVADDDGLLPEQVAPELAPGSLPEWEERWGPCAHPLVWSHGMFLAALAVSTDTGEARMVEPVET